MIPSKSLHRLICQKPGNCGTIVYMGSCRIDIINSISGKPEGHGSFTRTLVEARMKTP